MKNLSFQKVFLSTVFALVASQSQASVTNTAGDDCQWSVIDYQNIRIWCTNEHTGPRRICRDKNFPLMVTYRKAVVQLNSCTGETRVTPYGDQLTTGCQDSCDLPNSN